MTTLALPKIKFQHPLTAVILISAFMAFFMGMLGHATWHHAVEGAQALSGTVHYPQPTPFYIYQIKAWTLLHQIPALFFKLGFTEIQLSFIVSGLIAALSFTSLAVCTFALTGEIFLSVAMPYFIAYTRILCYGPVYPIILMGVTTSYGSFGQGWMLLTLGLLSLRKFRTGGFLLGLSPAIHIGLSAVTLGIAFLSLVFFQRDFFKPLWKPFLIGAGTALLSYAGHQLYVHPLNLPSLPLPAKELFCHYIRNWDSHRVSIPWNEPGFLVNMMMTGLSAVTLMRFRKVMPEHSLFLLKTAVTAGALSVAATALTQVKLELVPMPLLRFMPGRILNYNIILFPVLIIGVLKNHKKVIATVITLLTLLLFPYLIKFESDYTQPAISFVAMSAVIFLLLENGREIAPKAKQFLKISVDILFKFIFCFIIFKYLYTAWITSPDAKANFSDWSNNAFLKTTKENSGILLLGPDLSAIQMITRRPILIDGGALDIISYFPELTLPIAAILDEVYGLNLFYPPAGIDHVAVLPGDLNQPLWENRSPEEWKRLSKKYGFSEILTTRWDLKLPLVAEDESYKLHRAS